ncbi:MAG: DUF1559 domain-containing protein [Planctomycetia bacterium]|nr:DUF1559 domain-containing protein [Planctomycetia bacterium]
MKSEERRAKREFREPRLCQLPRSSLTSLFALLTSPVAEHAHRRQGLTLVELLIVISILSILMGLMLPAVQQARDAARAHNCRTNLMQIGLALRNYESAHGSLPPGTVDSQRPIRNVARGYHVGWLVRIAPYVEKTAYYDRFDFTLGVYDKKNSIAIPFPTLTCPSGSSYAGCHHDVESPIDIDNSGVLFLNQCISQDDVLDGISHTIYVGEKNGIDVFGWASGTRDSLRNTGTPMATGRGFSAAGAGAATPLGILQVGGFGSSHNGGANFLFGDGSVRFLSDSIDMPIFQQLGHRADGQLPNDGF